MKRLLPLVLPLLLAAFSAHAADTNLDALMQALARTHSARALFTEKKTLAMLDEPVTSSGELLYTAPDKLEKRTLKPRAETLVIDGDNLTVARGRSRHVVQLHEYPELAGLIDSIRGVLAGDRKALERSYAVKLDGSLQKWTLSLKPTDAKMATVIHLIRIDGSNAHVRTIETIQTDGDRSVMNIEPLESQ